MSTTLVCGQKIRQELGHFYGTHGVFIQKYVDTRSRAQTSAPLTCDIHFCTEIYSQKPFLRYRKIFDKIDKDKDGKVSEEELKNWIKYVQNKYIIDDTERQWKEHQLDENGQLTWAKYKERTYGYLDSKYS